MVAHRPEQGNQNGNTPRAVQVLFVEWVWVLARHGITSNMYPGLCWKGF